jgi:GAF domain-containing protein
MGTLAEQLDTALESARLYEDIQDRAVRDRLIGEVSARMRETLTVDAVLRSAVRQIGEALGIDEVEVRMRGEMRKSEERARS